MATPDAATSHTVLPPTDPGDRLAVVAHALDAMGKGRADDAGPPRPAAVLVGPDGDRIELPDELYEVLRHAARQLLGGRGVTISPHDQVLTTQEAADMLGVSRPTLVKLLEDGEIPYSQPGRHRRVKLADLAAYQERAKVRRRSLLREMTRDAEADGLYETGGGFVPTR